MNNNTNEAVALPTALASAIREAWHDAGWYARADIDPAILNALSLDARDALQGWRA